MGAYKDMADLVAAVKEEEEEILLCDGEDLRDASDESRLKALARERIQGRLRAEGLTALPEVPQYQHEPVYVTKIGSTADKLSSALNNPSEGGIDILRGAAGTSQPVVDQQAAVREAITAIEEAGKALASVANGDQK